MCKAITKIGSQCKKPPMKGSKYCYVHSFGRFKKIKILKNATIHAILFFVLTMYFGASKCNQEKLLKNDEDILENGATKSNQENILNETADIKKMLDDYIASDKNNYNDLLKKYPSGFLYFATNYYGLIAPPSSNIVNNYEFNWGNVKIEILEDSHIYFRLPNITYKPKNYSINNVSIRIINDSPGSIRSLPIYMMAISDNIYIEIISKNKMGIIMCIGFRSKSLGDLIK